MCTESDRYLSNNKVYFSEKAPQRQLFLHAIAQLRAWKWHHMIQKESYKTMLNQALHFQHGRPVPDLLLESFSTHHLKIKVIYYIEYKTTTTIIIIIDYLGQYGFENEMQADAAFVISLSKTKQQQKKGRDYRLLHELPIKTHSPAVTRKTQKEEVQLTNSIASKRS